MGNHLNKAISMMTASSSSLDPDKNRKRTTTGVLTMCSTEERCDISGWAGLPVDILDYILSKLTLLSDYDRFGAVCVSWRKASLDVGIRRRRLETQLSSPDHQGVPLLLLLSPRPMAMEDDGYQWRRSLYDIVQRKMVVQDNFKLPALPNSLGRCCGSSHGWLIIADNSLSITLLNPFYIGGGSRCQGGMIRLPPIVESPEVATPNKYIPELSISRAVLSADPALAPDDYLVMVIYSTFKLLAFIKSGDKDWTYFQDKSFSGYDDVVYRNGTIYAVSYGGDIYYCDTTKPFPRLRKFAPAPPSIVFSLTSFHYIMESPENQLLLVWRKHFDEPKYQTTGFKIFKLVVLGRQKEWVEVKTLGNYALFLGDNHSISVLAEASNGFPRVQPNSIYFTDHNLSNYACGPNILWFPTDMGVFNLEDQSLGQYYDLGSDLVCVPPPVWFLPSFPGNWS